MSAGSVAAARPAFQRARGGSTPTPALQNLSVRPVPVKMAKPIFVTKHYLHSVPGGTRMTFGVFAGPRLLGALALGVGPKHAHRLVAGAEGDDCLALTRLWLDNSLGKNAESRVIGIFARLLRKHTTVQFLVTYADPTQGHLGVIYQATGWLYTGLSGAMPLYRIGNGKPRHSRSFSHSFGTHSMAYLRKHGIPVEAVEQQAKHRYLLPLRPGVRERLTCPVLPYPKKEISACT